MAWALRADLTGPMPANHRLVLVTLADYADPDGTGAWPSQSTLGTRLGVTPRSVKRALDALEAKGLIVRGDQRLVGGYPANRRPVVWNLRVGSRALHTPRTEDHLDPLEARGDTPVTSGGPWGDSPDMSGVTVWGDTPDRPGVTPVSPKPTTKPPSKTPPPTPAPEARHRRPVCPHDMPGGLDLHPRTQLPACPLCRTGVPPTTEEPA